MRFSGNSTLSTSSSQLLTEKFIKFKFVDTISVYMILHVLDFASRDLLWIHIMNKRDHETG